MKRYKPCIIILLIITAVLQQQEAKSQSPDTLGINVLDAIVPYGGSDIYPTHYSNYGKGGHHQVADTNARNNISTARRLQGMLCTVLNDGTGNIKTFQLEGGIANTNWAEYTTGGTTGMIAGTGVTFNQDTINANTGTALWNASKLQGISISTASPTNDQLLKYTGSTAEWWTPNFSITSHTHATLTNGTGLSGSNYDGGTAQTWSVAYGTAAGTAVQGNQTATITAGTGITGGISGDALGNGFTATLNHEDLSSQATVNNSGGTVIQDVTMGSLGHVTALTSYNLDNRYYTETESDARYLQSYTETDPQVGSNTTSYIPRWNGSALVTGTIYDNGTNIGIGTTSPSFKLDVNGGISIWGNSYSIGGDGGGIIYHPTESSSAASRWALRFDLTNNASYPYLTNRTPNGAVVIKTGTASGGGENEHFRIKGGDGTVGAYFSNANVGIGTATPTQKLDVVGRTTTDGITIDGTMDQNGTADFSTTVDIHGTLDMNDQSFDAVRAIRGRDWDDNTGGADNKYRILFRDGAHMFYNGGVVVGNYGNGTWTDLSDGTLIVEGSTGIGTTSINASAKLEVTSTTQGFLPPRLTSAQMKVISNPAEGLALYNTTLKSICYYDGTRWDCPGYNARHALHKIVFVTISYWTGNLGGLSGANSKCQTEANSWGMPGTYKAWLSTDAANDPESTHNRHDGDYVRPDGVVIANDWADLTNSSIDNLINTRPDFVVITGAPVYNTATATAPNGTFDVIYNADCNNWTNSTTSYQMSYGSTLYGIPPWGAFWTQRGGANCTMYLRLFCFQQ